MNLRFFLLRDMVVASASLAFVSAGSGQQYTIIELGTLGGNWSRAFAVNDLGQVAGASPVSVLPRAFFWDSGTMTNLGTLGGSESYAYGINNNSQVTGWSARSVPEPHAFLWEGGPLIDLGAFGNSYSLADGINDAGQVVGQSNDVAFVWQDGVMTPLGVPSGFAGSDGHAINSLGQVAGHAWYCAGCFVKGWVWSDGAFDILEPLPDTPASLAVAINDSGLIGGHSAVKFPSLSYAQLWDPQGAVIDLGFDVDSEVLGVNNQGHVVGYAGEEPSTYRAFLWQDGIVIDLNEVIPANSGWTLFEAADINNVGQIVGWGINPAGQGRGFLLTPCEESDLNCDGVTNAFDLALLLGAWGPCPPKADCPADINNDGAVNPMDLALLLGNWG